MGKLTPTNELRWVKYEANKGKSVWYNHDKYLKLQQKFINEEGGEEWLLIPTVTVSTEKEFWNR